MAFDSNNRFDLGSPRKSGILERLSLPQVAVFQGIYFLLSGVWPLISIDTFMAVTGPKTDIWLVHTVGLLLAVTGSVLLMAGLRRTITAEIFILAVGMAAALTGIEIAYVSAGRISMIYLLDALIEVGFASLWIAVGMRRV